MYNFIFDRKSLALLVTGLAAAGLLLFAGGVLVGVNWAVPYQVRVASLPLPPLPAPPAPEARAAAARPELPEVAAEEVEEVAPPAEEMVDLEQEPTPGPAPAEPSEMAATAEIAEIDEPAPLEPDGTAPAALREPPPAEPDAAPTPLATSGGGYAVQVGAFRYQQSSEQIARDLESRGYQAYVEPLTNARGSLLHTVRFGRYADRKEAARAASEFRARERMAAIVQPAGSL